MRTKIVIELPEGAGYLMESSDSEPIYIGSEFYASLPSSLVLTVPANSNIAILHEMDDDE